AHGHHFSLKELTDALQVYVDNYNRWDSSQGSNHWCKKVGGAQTRLPAHVVNEYCRADRAFEPCPSEWESKLPRTQEVPRLWDSTQSKYIKGSWFIPPSAEDGLGLTYAFLRYTEHLESESAPGYGFFVWMAEKEELCRADLKALQSLWKTRTQQLKLLQSQLLSGVNQCVLA
ncbi:MAG: hypothetical protein JSR33_02440, partial [Proteobacteria bacterium]|nr:hypothetical protein [Pseudomonadota bacterium]